MKTKIKYFIIALMICLFTYAQPPTPHLKPTQKNSINAKSTAPEPVTGGYEGTFTVGLMILAFGFLIFKLKYDMKHKDDE